MQTVHTHMKLLLHSIPSEPRPSATFPSHSITLTLNGVDPDETAHSEPSDLNQDRQHSSCSTAVKPYLALT